MVDYLQNSEIQSVRRKLLWWQARGISYTATGYGRKIPTTVQIRIGNRWHRVYCVCYSNTGSCYVVRQGKPVYIDESYVNLALNLQPAQ
jgi:hypothetical protein